MSVNFAALVPHPPLAIPNLQHQEQNKVEQTIVALQELNQKITQANLDTLIVLTPHGQGEEQAFAINQSEELTPNLVNFGDLTKYPVLKNDVGLAYQIREYTETRLPVTLVDQAELDYGTAIPLLYFSSNFPRLKVIPIVSCHLNYERHLQFGAIIKEVSFRANKRVGIIASGNLAHTLTEDSPAGFNEAGKKFDNQIIDSLKTSKINSLLALPAEVVGAAVTCGFRPLLILLGIIREMNFTTEILSYETATGIGLLTANFKL